MGAHSRTRALTVRNVHPRAGFGRSGEVRLLLLARRPLVEDGYAVSTDDDLLLNSSSKRKSEVVDLPTEVLSFSGVSHSWRIAPITWCVVRHCRASGLVPTPAHNSHRED